MIILLKQFFNLLPQQDTMIDVIEATWDEEDENNQNEEMTIATRLIYVM